MRGRPVKNLLNSVTERNTPAYAGKTSQSRTSTSCGQKHPRVCGEDQGLRPRPEPVSETPPRMRGRPEDKSEKDTRARNTPAYAGKTIPLAPRRHGGEKHPRVCGEDVLPTSVISYVPETPPRMRGRSCICHQVPADIRNTPAYAGKTDNPGGMGRCKWKHPRVCGEDSSHRR